MSEDGGSAFPEIMTGFDEFSHQYNGDTYSFGGMTLRDYFAAKAMQGMLPLDSDNGRIRDKSLLDRTAEFSYNMADAMLEARKS